MQNSFKSMAQRLNNANETFIKSVISQFGFTRKEAEKILQVYKSQKIVKINPASNNFTLSHGIFWDKEIMQNALTMEV